MKKNILILLLPALAMCANLSCKKENKSSGIKAVFSYVADGFKVNFTDYSTNAKEYLWEFGDTSTSTLANPIHVYHSKGEFLAKLTVTNGQETNTFIDTVFVAGPNIKIDGDFTDWTYVDFSNVNEAGSGGTLLGVKTFASAGSLNFYLEGTADFNLAVMDMYIDADNDPETGFKSWQYPMGSGADFLLEGSVPGEWGDVYAHVGPGNDWDWNGVFSFGDVILFSEMKDNDGKKAIEFSIKRSALGTLKKFVNFAIVESNEGWTEIGAIPLDQTPDSKFAQIAL
jgi:PKD repeat protein